VPLINGKAFCQQKQAPIKVKIYFSFRDFISGGYNTLEKKLNLAFWIFEMKNYLVKRRLCGI